MNDKFLLQMLNLYIYPPFVFSNTTIISECKGKIYKKWLALNYENRKPKWLQTEKKKKWLSHNAQENECYTEIEIYTNCIYIYNKCVFLRIIYKNYF